MANAASCARVRACAAAGRHPALSLRRRVRPVGAPAWRKRAAADSGAKTLYLRVGVDVPPAAFAGGMAARVLVAGDGVKAAPAADIADAAPVGMGKVPVATEFLRKPRAPGRRTVDGGGLGARQTARAFGLFAKLDAGGDRSRLHFGKTGEAA